MFKPAVQRAPHEELLLELSPETYHTWRHHPVTAAYLLFLQDQIDAFRTAVADLVEAGQLGAQCELIRGQITALRELQTLKLDDIKDFYRKEETDDAAGKG